jgi:hypothetical protein
MRKKLDYAFVYRAGQTARSLNQESTDVLFSAKGNEIRFDFKLRSKGGGISDVQMTVGSWNFPTLLSSMLAIDRELVMCEMAKLLAAEIERQPQLDRATKQLGREAVRKAARDAYD